MKLLKDKNYVNMTTQIFLKTPAGIFMIRTIDDALIKISELEKRIINIEKH